MTASEFLRAARNKIEDESRWCQGQNVDPMGRMCTIGALQEVWLTTDQKYDEWSGARNLVHNHVTKALGAKNIADFNDGCTHGEVLAMFDAVIAEAEKSVAQAE